MYYTRGGLVVRIGKSLNIRLCSELMLSLGISGAYARLGPVIIEIRKEDFGVPVSIEMGSWRWINPSMARADRE